MPAKAKKQHYKLAEIQPITENQKRAYEEWKNNQHLFLSGVAGTGKTFISLALALKEVLAVKNNPYEKVYIIRSIVPSREMGFLPGSAAEKAAIYELPYKVIVDDIMGREDAYDLLKTEGKLEFVTTSHLRGLTFTNCICIIDEVQNLSGSECDTVITRMGENCRVVFSGDYKQTDLRPYERGGFLNFIKIIKTLYQFSFVEFTDQDIVRSGLVKEYIIAKDRLGIEFL